MKRRIFLYVSSTLLPRNSPTVPLLSRKGGKCEETDGAAGLSPLKSPERASVCGKRNAACLSGASLSVSRKRADRRGKRLFTGASFLPHFFRRGKKWGIAGQKELASHPRCSIFPLGFPGIRRSLGNSTVFKHLPRQGSSRFSTTWFSPAPPGEGKGGNRRAGLRDSPDDVRSE